MKLLQVKPVLHQFGDFTAFGDEFQIGPRDLIFTEKPIYEPYLKPLNLTAQVMLKDDFGPGEPSSPMINSIFAQMAGKDIDRVIAVGGGSVVDIAKLLVLKDATDTVALFQRKIPVEKCRQLIIVPTTCGTGSEMTNISIAELTELKTKMGLADDALLPDAAVLIPALLNTLPYKPFIASSIDALIHAVEAYVSPKATAYTDLFGREAIEIILKGYLLLLEQGVEARTQYMEQFLIASNYAGIAFGNAGVGAVHAMSYPLGGNYHVPHGEANYQFFTAVFKTYQAMNPTGKIAQLGALLARSLNAPQGADIYEHLDSVLGRLLPKKPLREYGMKAEECEAFAASVITGQQRLLGNNYAPFQEADILRIYKSLY